jgi:hypothetical protein
MPVLGTGWHERISQHTWMGRDDDNDGTRVNSLPILASRSTSGSLNSLIDTAINRCYSALVKSEFIKS